MKTRQTTRRGGVYRGVSKNGDRFTARVVLHGRRFYIGSYDSAEMAALAVRQMERAAR